MELLALDTFSDVCSAALLTDRLEKSRIAVRVTSEPRSHASQLAVFAKELLGEHETASKRGPDGILVVKGPGSYTGLRIGISTAKGLAWSLDLPLYAVSTLHYLGLGATTAIEGSTLFVAIHARVGEVFAARFVIKDHIVVRESEDKARSMEDFEAELSQFKGVSVLVSNDNVLKSAAEKASIPFEKVEPSLLNLTPLITNQIDKFRVEDLNSFEPAYLKEFVARKAAKNIFEKLQF